MLLAVPVCHCSMRTAVRLRTAPASLRIVVRSFSAADGALVADRTLQPDEDQSVRVFEEFPPLGVVMNTGREGCMLVQ